MKKKKALATMLAAVMALGMTACGSTNITSSSTSSTDTASTTSKENTSSSSAAQTTADEGAPYEVVLEWPAIGNTPTEENLQKIEAAINEVTVPEINCTVKLYPVELNDLSNANTLAISTGEKVDLIVSVSTGVGTLVDQGLIVPMDEYVDTYPAETWRCSLQWYLSESALWCFQCLYSGRILWLYCQSRSARCSRCRD